MDKSHDCVWMGGDVFKKLLDVLFSVLGQACLLASNGAEGDQYCEVDCPFIVK